MKTLCGASVLFVLIVRAANSGGASTPNNQSKQRITQVRAAEVTNPRYMTCCVISAHVKRPSFFG